MRSSAEMIFQKSNLANHIRFYVIDKYSLEENALQVTFHMYYILPLNNMENDKFEEYL